MDKKDHLCTGIGAYSSLLQLSKRVNVMVKSGHIAQYVFCLLAIYTAYDGICVSIKKTYWKFYPIRNVKIVWISHKESLLCACLS